MSDPTATTYISILGDLRVVRTSGANVRETLTIGGHVPRALLAALVFNRRLVSRTKISLQVWQRPLRGSNMLNMAISRLRNDLGEDADLISKRGHVGLVGAPTRIQTDWDVFCQLLESAPSRAPEALALVRGIPLDGIDDGEKSVGEFARKLRTDILTRILAACSSLKLPTEFTWDDPIPQDWPRTLPPEWPAPIEVARGPHVDRGPRRHDPQTRRLRDADGIWTSHGLFESSKEGENRLAKELADARAGESTWWPDGAQKWLGGDFAFWHRTVTISCEGIALEYVSERYDSGRYLVEPGEDGDNDKAIILEASRLFHDNPDPHLVCAKTNWSFAQKWAPTHAEDLLDGPSRTSVFGLVERTPYPGIAGVHSLVQTSDGYFLFGLRDSRVGFYPRTWSASFEESIAVTGRDFTGPDTGDQTVFDTVAAGLYEEWGIEASEIETSSFLAVGREFVRSPDGRLDLNSPILAAVRLAIGLQDVWDVLSDVSGIRDRDEHAAWAGVRFASREHVLGFLASARLRHENVDLLVDLGAAVGAEVDFCPAGASSGIPDRGLMPTSAARLYLGSMWLARYGWMDVMRA